MNIRNTYIYAFVCVFLVLASCIKQIEKEFAGNSVAEIDATVVNPNAAGVTYPIITRVPAMGRALTTTCPDSVLRRFSGNIRLRINLVGPQSDKEETVGFTTFEVPSTVTTISFPATIAASPSSCVAGTTAVVCCPTAQSPSRAANSSLAVSNAVMGTHYNFTNSANGKIVIPANSSFGYLDISILNPGVSAGSRFIGIKLDSTGTVLPSVNYRQLGIVIDQR